MTDVLFAAYDDHTQQVQEFTRKVITKLVNEHGANEDWISVGSLYYAVSGMYLGHIMDDKPLLTVDEFLEQQMDFLMDVVLGF